MYVEEVHRSPFYFLLICNVLIKIHNLLKEEHVPINLSKMMKQIKQMS